MISQCPAPSWQASHLLQQAQLVCGIIFTSNGFAATNPGLGHSPQATHLYGQILLADEGAISDAGLLGDAPNTPPEKIHLRKENEYMTNYTSMEQLPITLSANQVAQVLGISRANAYTLMHSKGFPTIQIGKRMVVPKNKLIEWMEKQTAS